MSPIPTPLTRRETVTIRPGDPLAGLVRADGSKNAALPLLAAAACVRRAVHLDNVPDSADVQQMLALLAYCGGYVARPVANPRGVALMPVDGRLPVPQLADAARIRASYYLVPALLAACGQARLPWPGGCQIGDRGMDQHLKVYEAFGDKVESDRTGYQITAAENISEDVVIDLPFRSRGASVVAVLRAVVGRRRLLLRNPNLSPEFTGTLDFLRAAGWQVDLGTATATVVPLISTDTTPVAGAVPGDKIEAGTLACAIASTGGSGRIEGVRGQDTTAVVEALTWLGLPATAEADALVVHGGGEPSGMPLRAVASLAPGGLDADFEPALPDPGRDDSATLTELARYLDEPVTLRNSELGEKITDHVWHCPVRAAPEDRYHSDAEWGEIAERIVRAAGIAPKDDDLGCRWIAVRHADDHIHILATTVREDGLRPERHRDGARATAECRLIEKDYGLRQLNSGDRTAAKRPTQGEMHKAKRLGWDQTSREWLQDRIRAAIPHAADVEELLAYLAADGVQVKPRRGPSGDLLGYSAGRPGDLNKDGKQVFHPGGKIAPDLSLPKLQARLAAGAPEEHPTARRNRPSTPWQRATDALDTLPGHLADPSSNGGEGDGGLAQAQIAALGELIEATAQTAPADLRAELRAATRTFARAQRSQIRAEHRAAAGLRTAARDLVNAGSSKDGSTLAVLIAALVWAVILAERWHEARGHAQQAAAARQTVQHLQAVYDQAAAPQLAELASRQPKEDTRNILAGDVRAAVPEHAARILADPNWPALATVLADAQAGGHQAHQLLKEAAEQRELNTARLPARVLLTRIQHTARNPIPSPVAEAARQRSSTRTALPRPVPTQSPAPLTAPQPGAHERRHR